MTRALHHALRERLGLACLILALAGCRCTATPSRPHAYDVGVPLEELPRSAARSAGELVAGEVLALAETPDLRALLRSASATPEAAALSHAGILQILEVTRTGSTLSALAQRLNDLSRAPMGEGILDGVLEGPLTVAARSSSKGTIDLLAVKPLPASATTALRLAVMLEEVHPSAQQVRVERHRGIPVRHLRLDADRTLYYFVLRDLLVLGTELGWVTSTLDRALGEADPTPPLSSAIALARSRCAGTQGYLIVDGLQARDAVGLSLAGRALAGLQWAALRFNPATGLELGLRRARGAFHGSGEHLTLAKGTALVVEREVTMDELLAVSALRPAELTDGGSEGAASARALLTDAAAALAPVAGPHALYALGPAVDPAGFPRHTVALEAADVAASERALLGLAPRLFRQPLRFNPDGEGCLGSPAALCAEASEGGLAFTNGSWGRRTGFGGKATASHLEAAPALIYVDPPQLFAAVEGPEAADEAARRLGVALQGLKPRWVRASAIEGSPEAWGRVADAPASAP